MKRKKIISGKDSAAEIVITIEIESTVLMRYESDRLMDAAAGEVMRMFDTKLPYISVPLVRLKVR